MKKFIVTNFFTKKRNLDHYRNKSIFNDLFQDSKRVLNFGHLFLSIFQNQITFMNRSCSTIYIIQFLT
jgi:hypothetical protein